MTIRFPKEPNATKRVLSQGIADLELARSGGLAERGSPKKAASPIRLFQIGLDDLANSKTIDAVESAGWQYFVVSPDDEIESVEINDVGAGGGQQFAGASSHQETASLLDAIRYVESTYSESESEFEIRLLRIPGLYVTCIWLKAAGDKDQFVMVDTISPALQIKASYSADQLFSEIIDLARQRMSQPDSPEGRGRQT